MRITFVSAFIAYISSNICKAIYKALFRGDKNNKANSTASGETDSRTMTLSFTDARSQAMTGEIINVLSSVLEYSHEPLYPSESVSAVQAPRYNVCKDSGIADRAARPVNDTNTYDKNSSVTQFTILVRSRRYLFTRLILN